MRVLVTGGGGQLGRALARALTGHEAVVLGRDLLDVTDPVAVEGVIRSAAPDAIVHAAAWTDVDGCENDPERARLCNVGGTQNVVEAAGRAFVVVVSTDFVFDGTLGRAYQEDDTPNPIQVYGRTKREAEQIALEQGATVARTAWLYGPGGKNFVTAILGALGRNELFEVVDDQVGSPTSCDDLARALVRLCSEPMEGIVHTINAGEVSRHAFARKIAQLAGSDPELVRPVATADTPPRPAKRPLFAPLRSKRSDRLADWDAALDAALPAILAEL